MTTRNAVRAFSVVEAMVGLVVMAVVIGLVFVVFSILSRQLSDLRYQNEKVSDVNRLSWVMQRDMFGSRELSYTEERLEFSDYKGQSAYFEFGDSAIVRHSETFADTFHIRPISVLLDTIGNVSGKKTMSRLQLVFDLDARVDSLRFYKNIYPAERLNANQDVNRP
ncbi:hypothetical protein HUK80_00020 [Flavobacterium sp. MAH-1]|uniref:Prepilin-type N-terminal cleavage/methylation domain-containing protein n=1 Tax=Flavobacterium agri TaxID=2743471 RepID=A0A7Y9C3W6_9FLAO|nr:hypothetical protein [Flavobacterium agri]NUY79261.1 hypothetical protein [Flavobacterium agri]NYA69285.1 hypothetical protein [Flavobacterium agri]